MVMGGRCKGRTWMAPKLLRKQPTTSSLGELKARFGGMIEVGVVTLKLPPREMRGRGRTQLLQQVLQ